MNYFLLANNNNFSESTINKLKFNINTDIIILFNFLIPFKFDKVKYYANKICVSRRRRIQGRLNSKLLPGIKEYYCNMGTIKQYQDLFKEIYFLGCPHNMQKDEQSYIDNINIFNFDKNKLCCIDYDPSNMSKKLGYNGDSIQAEVSTGVITYEYFKYNKKKQDNIILVAFTSELTKFHDKEWEQQYFLNEIKQKICYTIDSYDLIDSWPVDKINSRS